MGLESICNYCRHEQSNKDEKPCSTCFDFVDGFLEAQNYKPKIYTPTNKEAAQ